MLQRLFLMLRNVCVNVNKRWNAYNCGFQRLLLVLKIYL